MIPYLWGAFIYATASKNAEALEKLSSEQRRERIHRMERAMEDAAALLIGAVVGGLVAITLNINTPKKSDDNFNLGNNTQQVQVYDVDSNYSR